MENLISTVRSVTAQNTQGPDEDDVSHLSNVYEKMGVRSRGEAARKALSEGWISAWDVSRED
jgi:hypothetical protein